MYLLLHVYMLYNICIYYYMYICYIIYVWWEDKNHTRTEFIPEASSRPFILIYETHKDSPVRTINMYIDPLRSFTLYRLTMCDRAPLSIYVGFPPIVCTL